MPSRERVGKRPCDSLLHIRVEDRGRASAHLGVERGLDDGDGLPREVVGHVDEEREEQHPDLVPRGQTWPRACCKASIWAALSRRAVPAFTLSRCRPQPTSGSPWTRRSRTSSCGMAFPLPRRSFLACASGARRGALEAARPGTGTGAARAPLCEGLLVCDFASGPRFRFTPPFF